MGEEEEFDLSKIFGLAGLDYAVAAQAQHLAKKNKAAKTDRTKQRVGYVNLPYYQVDTGQSIGNTTLKLPLGHSGVVFQDENGNTQYYEYGRYDADEDYVIGKKAFGNWKHRPSPNLKNMTDAQFEDSLYRMIAPEHGGNDIDIYWENVDDINRGINYIKTEANNPSRAAYCLRNPKTCATEARNAYDASLSKAQLRSKSKPVRLPFIGGLPIFNKPSN